MREMNVLKMECFPEGEKHATHRSFHSEENVNFSLFSDSA